MRKGLWLLLSLLASGTTWLYLHRVQRPWEYHMNVEIGTLRAELGDMYSPWVGTRGLLRYGRNPYGPEVSHEIQMAFYGHIVTQNEKSRRIDEQRFAYPVYVVFLIAPIAYCEFEDVERWSLPVLALLTAGSVLLWLEVVHWRPPAATIAALILFIFSSPQLVQGFRIRQLGLLVGLLLALAAWCVTKNRLAIAGSLLAISTIKPQMVILPLAWFLLWGVSDWEKRWRLLASFAATLAVLVGAGELLLPGWLRYFFEGVAAYRRYTFRASLLDVAFGERLGTLGTAMIIIAISIFAWRNRKQAGDSQGFTLTLALVFMAAVLSLPLLHPFNQVMLILPVLMLLRDWATLRNLPRLIFILCVSWPWLASFALLLFPPRSEILSRFFLAPAYQVLLMPFVLPLLLAVRRPSPT